MNTIENIKLKNQSKVRKIKRIFATLLASMVALITATMSGSVYASDFDNQPIPYAQGSTYQVITENGMLACTRNNHDYYVITNTQGVDVYVFSYINTANNNTYTLVFACENTFNGLCAYEDTKTSVSSVSYDDTSGMYYSITGIGTYNYVTAEYVTKYDTLSDGLNAVYSYINSNNNPPIFSSRKVEAGNVAILDFGSGVFNYDLTLTSYNYQKSGLFQGANAWNENGQAYYWSFTLPVSGDSVSGTQITWDKAPSTLYPRDALGQTHYGISEMSGTGAARYLLIINPYINKISESGQGDVNGWINIDGIPEGVGVYIYPMQQTITGLSNENVISPTEENPGGYGVATSQGGIVDTTTIGGDSAYIQTTGGANSSMPLATIGDYVEDINNTLSGFSQNFLNLLKAPIEYIKALVEGAQNFFAYIAGLFSWLPQDINAFVITGLMLVVIVGIFHSLL